MAIGCRLLSIFALLIEISIIPNAEGSALTDLLRKCIPSSLFKSTKIYKSSDIKMRSRDSVLEFLLEKDSKQKSFEIEIDPAIIPQPILHDSPTKILERIQFLESILKTPQPQYIQLVSDFIKPTHLENYEDHLRSVITALHSSLLWHQKIKHRVIRRIPGAWTIILESNPEALVMFSELLQVTKKIPGLKVGFQSSQYGRLQKAGLLFNRESLKAMRSPLLEQGTTSFLNLPTQASLETIEFNALIPSLSGAIFEQDLNTDHPLRGSFQRIDSGGDPEVGNEKVLENGQFHDALDEFKSFQDRLAAPVNQDSGQNSYLEEPKSLEKFNLLMTTIQKILGVSNDELFKHEHDLSVRSDGKITVVRFARPIKINGKMRVYILSIPFSYPFKASNSFHLSQLTERLNQLRKIYRFTVGIDRMSQEAAGDQHLQDILHHFKTKVPGYDQLGIPKI